ncbi:major capsid protein [Halorubrum tailed virus 25]|uniref:Major capsid protein n=1 Tax=Halorubrum tailed virus 25 TaxID=2878006 RepID=A0AAE8XYP9_9CAUD|nr:major head protein [Halorubrum tailed virus 25]UBF22597.1 major capsid protein [Halorubrum tailed virus 25]
MANPARKRELTTKDDVPLSDLLGYGMELIETYREAPRTFLANFTQEVSSRVFMARTGDMTWNELAEMEHARTGTLDRHQMAFSVKSYGRSLGYSREFIEDNPSEMLREEMAEMIRGADDKEFEVLFDVLKNGVADGTQLWYTPRDYAGQSFSDTHSHTYADTEALFGDTNAHAVSEHIREANKDLREHGYRPAVALVSHDVAAEMVAERTDGQNYHIPEAEGLREGALPEQTLIEDGVRFVQTAWLNGSEANDVFVISQNGMNGAPIKTNYPRPVELTDNTGAPIGGAGGSYGDPAALLGAYGSMRMGAKMADPLAAVKFTADNIA